MSTSSIESKGGGSSIIPVNLRYEYLKDPLGLDMPNPRFSWILEGRGHGGYQRACRVLAASSKDNLGEESGDKWDSGKIESDRKEAK